MIEKLVDMNKKCDGYLLDSLELENTSKALSRDEVQISFYGTGNTGKLTRGI